MYDFFNWNDTWILFDSHGLWMLAALAIGVFVGWRSNETASE